MFAIGVPPPRVLINDPENARTDQKSVARISRDGGKTWKDMGVGKGTERRNFFVVASFSKDGTEYYAAFVNATGIRDMRDEDSTLIFRRWGK